MTSPRMTIVHLSELLAQSPKPDELKFSFESWLHAQAE
jgi:hypothetical protein